MKAFRQSGRRVAALLVFAPLLFACRRGERHRYESWGEIDPNFLPLRVAQTRGIPADSVRAIITQRLDSGPMAPLGKHTWTHVKALYQEYGDNALWLDSTGLRKGRTAALLDAVASADSDALQLSGYPLGALGRALAVVRGEPHPTAQQLADADVLLTATYAAYGEDMVRGQLTPSSQSQDWHINPEDEDVDSALAGVLRTQNMSKAIAEMRPPDPQYDSLMAALQQYRGIVANGGWPSVPTGKALTPGDAAPASRLAALRGRLAAEGLLPAAARRGVTGDDGRTVYDSALAGAVAHYQALHAIGVDSVLGPETVSSLNLSAEYRTGQIAGNLERFRWLPRHLGSRYIVVNVPAFRLTAYDSGQASLTMKVIVGAEYNNRNTPVFSDSMKYVVFRPYWLVPDGIADKEIWPKAQQDPDYLSRNHYETYTEDGKTRVRQTPGDWNSLGLVKFLFPNDYAIYLHDTPEDQLFSKDVRAFSHGCIRLEHPAELAQWVLGWPMDRVQSAMHDGPDDQRIELPQRIPVYILYFTTYIENGELYFGNDLYGHDGKLVQAVRGGALPSPEALAAERALREIAHQLGGPRVVAEAGW